jgi:hypothetical protein
MIAEGFSLSRLKMLRDHENWVRIMAHTPTLARLDKAVVVKMRRG